MWWGGGERENSEGEDGEREVSEGEGTCGKGGASQLPSELSLLAIASHCIILGACVYITMHSFRYGVSKQIVHCSAF